MNGIPVTATASGFARQALRLAGPYWRAPGNGRARVAAVALAALTVGQVGLSIWGNYWNRALFDALEQRSAPAVLVQVGVFALILAVSVVVTGAHLLVKRWLQLDWRRWLTRHLVGDWLASGRQQRLALTAGDHDNPDARIAEDIRIATESALALAHTFTYALLTLALFIGILWTVSGTLRLGDGVSIPGYLVPLAFAYALAGSLLGWVFGQPLVRTTDALQSAEADFRFGLAQAREQSEAIALLHGEGRERAAAGNRFARLARDWNRQSLAYLGVVAFGTAYGALLPVFPTLVAAPQYIAGVMSLGVLMQAAQAFQRVASALSWPVDNLGELARCRASAERVLHLHGDLLALDDPRRDGARVSVSTGSPGELAWDALRLTEPGGRSLSGVSTAVIRRGERVLVTGEPAALASLFKALAGLWPWGTGTIRLPPDERVESLPQQPFLPAGSLAAALEYPDPPGTHAAPALHRALECAGVAWLAPRLTEAADWDHLLPLRTRQHLAVARALLHEPAWLVVEDAAGGADPRGDGLTLDMLRHELPGATLVTLSSSPELAGRHQRTVLLPPGAPAGRSPDQA